MIVLVTRRWMPRRPLSCTASAANFRPSCVFARAGDADDQSHAAAWITRSADAEQALAQRRKLFAPPGEVRGRVALGAEFNWCSRIVHDDSVASKATAAAMQGPRAAAWGGASWRVSN